MSTYEERVAVLLRFYDPDFAALGEIWWAENGEGFFRQRWLVTRDGLEEANYEFVDN